MTKDMRKLQDAKRRELARMREDRTLDTVPQWVLRARYPLTMGATMAQAKDMTGATR